MKILLLSISLIISSIQLSAQSDTAQKFICPPCGCNSDTKKFNEVGECPGCGMNLVGEINPSEGYAYRNIYPEDVCGFEKDEWIFLDVRTKREFNGELGHLTGSIHIHVEDLEDRLGELRELKDKNILVYCRISVRSMRASQLLVDKGFTKVTNMLGGMELWDDMDLKKLPCKESGRVFQ